MKSIFKTLSGMALAAIIFTSCKKQISEIQYTGGTNPVVTAAPPSSTLSKANENNVWDNFSWTNPNYQFSTGISSQDVTYTLQFDTTGDNFHTASILQEIVVARDLSRDVTVKEINTAMAKMGLMENLPHNVEMRVKSTLLNSSVPLYSNVLKFVLTPYLDVVVALPTTDKLYLVGDATSGGWNNPVPVPSQQFTKTSSTTWEITAPMIGGKEYLILPLNGDWGHKYAVANKALPGLNAGGNFGYDLSDNFPGPSASGNYKIVVNFKTGQFTVTKL